MDLNLRDLKIALSVHNGQKIFPTKNLEFNDVNLLGKKEARTLIRKASEELYGSRIHEISKSDFKAWMEKRCANDPQFLEVIKDL